MLLATTPTPLPAKKEKKEQSSAFVTSLHSVVHVLWWEVCCPSFRVHSMFSTFFFINSKSGNDPGVKWLQLLSSFSSFCISFAFLFSLQKSSEQWPKVVNTARIQELQQFGNWLYRSWATVLKSEVYSLIPVLRVGIFQKTILWIPWRKEKNDTWIDNNVFINKM